MKRVLRSLLILMILPISLAFIWTIQAAEKTLPHDHIQASPADTLRADTLFAKGLRVPHVDTLRYKPGIYDLLLRPEDKNKYTVRDLLFRPEDQPRYAYIDTLKYPQMKQEKKP